MKILVLNCGSSSLKFQLIETGEEQIASDADRILARGTVERIGSDDARLSYQVGDGPKEEKTAPVPGQAEAIQFALDHLMAPGGVLKDPKDVEAVGHRVVHGGEDFPHSVLIDDAVLAKIESVSDLAPLHNPSNLKGYRASRALFPQAGQAAVFDTSFHHTLPPRAYLFGIPYEWYSRDKVRRYGFHGTSYRYVSERYARLAHKSLDTLKLVVCHLGNGCSLCAIDRGKSVDTSMGLTPMDGLLMGTRPGELDPSAVLYMAKREAKGVEGVESLLNQRSGLHGLSGGTSDMRDLLKKRDSGDARAKDAIDVFCYRLVKYIGAYTTAMGGADALIFTGGIGEHSQPIRSQVCGDLGFLGVELDDRRNADARGSDTLVSTDKSRIPVWVVPTDEERMIARDTFLCVRDRVVQ